MSFPDGPPIPGLRPNMNTEQSGHPDRNQHRPNPGNRSKSATPEAKIMARNRISEELQRLAEEQKLNADRRAKGSHIPLEQLGRDYPAEKAAGERALEDLSYGDATGVVNVLSKIATRQKRSMEDAVESQKSATAEHEAGSRILSEARNLLKVDRQERNRLVNLGQLDAAINIGIINRLYQAHPDWRGSKDPRIIALRDRQVIEQKQLMANVSPEQLLAEAKSITSGNQASQLELFTRIQYKEWKLLDAQRARVQEISREFDRLAAENQKLESLIADLGGRPADSQGKPAAEQQAKPQSQPERTPAKREIIVNTTVGPKETDSLCSKDHGAWRVVNASVVERSLVQTLQQLGYRFPSVDMNRISYALPSETAPPNLQLNANGESPPVWMEYVLYDIRSPRPAERVAINNQAEYQRALVTLRQLYPQMSQEQIQSQIKMNMNFNLANQMTPEEIRTKPEMLQQVAACLLRYADTSQPPAIRLRDVNLKAI
jgi:hypothetical protein